MSTVTRREMVQLGAVAASGITVSLILQTTRSPGQDVSNRAAVTDILHDRASPTLEHRNANLTLVVFTDYQCPACKLSSPAMDRAVADDGRVRVVYKDWPVFGLMSENAARIAIATSWQGIYPAVHSRLMAERQRLDETTIRNVVEAAGGNWQRTQSDLKNHANEIQSQLGRNSQQAFALSLDGTPGYLAGPYLVRGALDYAGFMNAFKAARLIDAPTAQ